MMQSSMLKYDIAALIAGAIQQAQAAGTLPMGSARNAAIGDVLANILAAANYQVEREYYVNDAGSQIRTFGASVFARYQQLLGRDVPFPEKGYQGDYINDIAQAILET